MAYATAMAAPPARMYRNQHIHPLRYIQVNANSIRWLQQAMNKLLGTRLILTGKLTQHTIAAIIKMQRQLHIPPNGRISNLLLDGVRRLLNEPHPPKPPLPPMGGGIRPYPPSGGIRPVAPVQPHVCTNCGTPGLGCTTLGGFGFNKTLLTLHQKHAIRLLAQKISRRPASRITLTGHTDKVGTDAYNYRLGMNRALAAGYELLKNLHSIAGHPIKILSLKFISRGEMQPASTTNKALNRRVEICLH